MRWPPPRTPTRARIIRPARTRGFWASCSAADGASRAATMMRRVAFACALQALALCVLAGTATRAQNPRPYRPAIDVLDYDLTIDLPDSGNIIRGTALLTVRRAAPTDSLVLDLLDLAVEG